MKKKNVFDDFLVLILNFCEFPDQFNVLSVFGESPAWGVFDFTIVSANGHQGAHIEQELQKAGPEFTRIEH